MERSLDDLTQAEKFEKLAEAALSANLATGRAALRSFVEGEKALRQPPGRPKNETGATPGRAAPAERAQTVETEGGGHEQAHPTGERARVSTKSEPKPDEHPNTRGKPIDTDRGTFKFREQR